MHVTDDRQTTDEQTDGCAMPLAKRNIVTFGLERGFHPFQNPSPPLGVSGLGYYSPLCLASCPLGSLPNPHKIPDPSLWTTHTNIGL